MARRRCSASTTPARCSTNSAMRLHGMLSDVTYPFGRGHECRARFRRAALAALRALAAGAGGAEEIRAARRDGRAHSGRSRSRASPPRAISIRASRRSSSAPRPMSISTFTRKASRRISTRAPSRRTASRGFPCRRKSSCGTACRISRISSPATAIRPAITAISGPKRSTPTPSRPSRRRATPSRPRSRERLRDHIYAAGGRQDAADAYMAFRGRMPTVEPLLRQRGFAEPAG